MLIQFIVIDRQDHYEWSLILYISCLESFPRIRTLFYFKLAKQSYKSFKEQNKIVSYHLFVVTVYA
jgi:hypothetical protein